MLVIFKIQSLVSELTSGFALLTGLLTRSTADQGVFDVEDCWLQDSASNRILNMIKPFITGIQLKVRTAMQWSLNKAHSHIEEELLLLQGGLIVDKIVIRRGLHPQHKTAEYMVIFHTWTVQQASRVSEVMQNSDPRTMLLN